MALMTSVDALLAKAGAMLYGSSVPQFLDQQFGGSSQGEATVQSHHASLKSGSVVPYWIRARYCPHRAALCLGK